MCAKPQVLGDMKTAVRFGRGVRFWAGWLCLRAAQAWLGARLSPGLLAAEWYVCGYSDCSIV